MTETNSSAIEQMLGLAAPTDDAFSAETLMLEEAFLSLHGQDDEGVSLPDNLFGQIMSRIDQQETAPGTSTIAMSDGVWEDIAPGIERKIVYVNRVEGVQSYFVRMQAGATLQEHEHDADEQCVILQGQLEIGGEIFEAGTYHLARRGIPHVPITAHSDAIFFIHGAF